MNVTIQQPDGTETTFECADDQYILDAAGKLVLIWTIPAAQVPVLPVQVKFWVALLTSPTNPFWMTIKLMQDLCLPVLHILPLM